MGCEEAHSMLDAFVDGELSAQQERALMEHAAGCEACGREIEAAILLRDAMKDMDAEVSVPLEAQTAWRRAVRAETGKTRGRRWMRYACGAAAALVLVVGCTFALRGDVFKQEHTLVLTDTQPLARSMPAAQADGELIAADGVQETSASGAAAAEADDYTIWKKYEAADVDAACAAVEALAVEYSGSFSMEKDDGLANCRVELPCDYAEDFLSAVERIGRELDSRSVEPAGDTAVISILIDAVTE